MNVGIKIERSIELPVPVAQSRQLIQDYQVTFRRFPKLRKLTRLDVVAESVAGINATLKAAAKRNAESPRNANAARARPAARSRPRSAGGFDA